MMKFYKYFKSFLLASIVFCFSLNIQAQYTLTDADVVVTDGVLQSCSYDFTIKDIIIPETLDGQTVTGIGRSGYYTFESKGITSIQLPSTTEDIAPYTFESNSISSVLIPSNVVSIGKRAFQDNQIVNLTFEAGSKLSSIGDNAFKKNLIQNVEIPKDVLSIGMYSFHENSITGLTFEEGCVLKSIGQYAFYYNSISSLSVPDSVTTIDDFAFGNNNLSTLTLAKNLVSIGEEVFSDNSLTSVMIPKNVVSIGRSSFSDNSLTSVTFEVNSNLTEIQASAFVSNSITSVAIPSNVKTIGSGAFAWNSLTSINIPSNVETIGGAAFRFNNISNVTFESNSNIITINAYVFNDNSSLSFFTLPIPVKSGFIEWIDEDGNVLSGGTNVSAFDISYIAQYAYTLTDSDVIITNGIIESCSYDFSANNLIIPNELDGQTITGISEGIFQSKSLVSIDLPENLEEIGRNAFSKNSITEVIIPNSVTIIGESSFENNLIQSLTFEPTSSVENIMAKAFYQNKITNLEIPNSTKSVAHAAFASNNISTLALPNNLRHLGSMAFNYNSISTINSIISNGIFYARNSDGTENNSIIVSYGGTSNNLNFINASVNEIADSAFYGNTLSSVTIPNTVMNIRKSAFEFNAMISLTFESESNIDTIEKNAFFGNAINGTLVIPNSVRIIGETAFSNNSLLNVSFESNSIIEVIGNLSFSKNAALSPITLPTPTKFGHTFDNWVDEYSNSYNGGEKISDFRTYYYAQYTPDSYLVIFNDWDATQLKQQSVAHGEAATAPIDPTRNGYVFTGWNIDFTNITADTTITAQYSLLVPPAAAFSTDLTSGQAPLEVSFTDESTNSPSSWSWDFNGDGTEDATTQNPSYTYSSPGTYTVKLTVTNGDGSDTETKINYISVSAVPTPPVAAFSADVTSGQSPLEVTFTDESTNSPSSWSWDFNGDGTEDATTQNPSHTYSTPGTYTVELTVTNDDGSDTETKTDYITVSEASVTTYEVTFNLWEQISEDFLGATITINSTSEISDVNGQAIFNLSPDTYDYTITKTGYKTISGILTVVDEAITRDVFLISISGCPTITSFPYSYGFEEDGYFPTCWQEEQVSGITFPSWQIDDTDMSEGSYSIYASNESTEADVIRLISPVFDLSSAVGAALIFSHKQEFYDPDQDELRVYYRTSEMSNWQLLAEYTTNIATWTEETFLVLPDLSPNYQFAFEATLKYGNGVYLDGFYVNKVPISTPPVAAFSANLTTGQAPLEVTFTDESTNSPSSWSWDFDGDGTEDATTQNPSYTYSTPGTYTVELTVSNGDGNDTETKTNYITVSAVPTPPVAAFSANVTSGQAPLEVSFTDESTNSPSSWSWDFNGDGTEDATTQSPSHTYSTPGTYAVELTVTNGDGSDTETKTNYISVSSASNCISLASAYILNFENDSDIDDWITADDNNDGTTWYRSTEDGINSTGSATYYYNEDNAADDWLISSCFDLQAGVNYDISFYYATGGFDEKLKVYTGTDQNSAMSDVLVDLGTVNNTEFQKSNNTLSVATTGSYHIGWHCTSDANTFYLSIDSIVIKQQITITPPVAAFTANTTSGQAPLEVFFTDESTNSPSSWSWDFDGDGTEDATVQNPSFTYNTAGTYTVKLTVTNADGSDTKSITDYIIVNSVTLLTQIKESNRFKIYPNPANDFLQIEFSEIKAQEIRVQNVIGDLIYSTTNVNSLIHKIDLAGLNTGIYILHVIYENNNVQTGKFIKQ